LSEFAVFDVWKMNRTFESQGGWRLVAVAVGRLLLGPGRTPADLLEGFTPDFLNSLGYTDEIVEKLKSGTLTEAQAEQWRRELCQKGGELWPSLWHAEFNRRLGGRMDEREIDKTAETATLVARGPVPALPGAW
jgi:hypothetical protein